MFDDFNENSGKQSRKRFGNSIVAAFVIYGSSSALIVAATATARQVVEEELKQVEFAPAPPPEPEPPPPEPEAAPPPKTALRPKAKRQVIKPPDEVPLEKPKESDAPLAEAGDTGPVDGSLDGVEGGTGTGRAPAPAPPPPPKKAGPISKPTQLGSASDNKPKYPKGAERKGIEGTVFVDFDVLENGKVANARIVSGPPELHEAVLKALPNWRFKPAMQDGKPVRFRVKNWRITFRLEDA
jgi:protein TonB